MVKVELSASEHSTAYRLILEDMRNTFVAYCNGENLALNKKLNQNTQELAKRLLSDALVNDITAAYGIA